MSSATDQMTIETTLRSTDADGLGPLRPPRLTRSGRSGLTSRRRRGTDSVPSIATRAATRRIVRRTSRATTEASSSDERDAIGFDDRSATICAASLLPVTRYTVEQSQLRSLTLPHTSVRPGIEPAAASETGHLDGDPAVP